MFTMTTKNDSTSNVANESQINTKTATKSKSIPLFFFNKTFQSELVLQSIIAAPSIITRLLYKLPWLFSLHYVGEFGALELASAALALTVCGITGQSLSVGLNFALVTLTGQARGDLLLQGEYYLKNEE